VLYEKTLSNIQEVKAREGIVIAVVTQGDQLVRKTADHVIEIPESIDLLTPILEVVPLQLLPTTSRCAAAATWTSRANLAKSVTVE